MNLVAQRACKRCRHSMSRVAEIAPFGGGPGLVAFMCTDCGTTDSVLVHEPHTARGADHRQDQNPGRECYVTAAPTVSAITAPRVPSGFSGPTVESRAV